LFVDGSQGNPPRPDSGPEISSTSAQAQRGGVAAGGNTPGPAITPRQIEHAPSSGKGRGTVRPDGPCVLTHRAASPISSIETRRQIRPAPLLGHAAAQTIPPMAPPRAASSQTTAAAPAIRHRFSMASGPSPTCIRRRGLHAFHRAPVLQFSTADGVTGGVLPEDWVCSRPHRKGAGSSRVR